MDSKQEVDLFADLCSSDERLTDVEGQYVFDDSTPMLTAIKITFEPTIVILVAQDDDSIKVLTDGPLVDLPHSKVRTLLHTPAWEKAALRPLLWAWKMVNQQGYFDGLQFDFANSAEESVSRVQLLVVGSEFKVAAWPIDQASTA